MSEKICCITNIGKTAKNDWENNHFYTNLYAVYIGKTAKNEWESNDSYTEFIQRIYKN